MRTTDFCHALLPEALFSIILKMSYPSWTTRERKTPESIKSVTGNAGHDGQRKHPPSPCAGWTPFSSATVNGSIRSRAGRYLATIQSSCQSLPQDKIIRKAAALPDHRLEFRTIKAGVLSRLGEAVLQRHGIAIL